MILKRLTCKLSCARNHSIVRNGANRLGQLQYHDRQINCLDDGMAADVPKPRARRTLRKHEGDQEIARETQVHAAIL